MKMISFLQRCLAAIGVFTVLTVLPVHSLAEDGVTPKQLLIGQSISLQDGKNEYAAAVQDGIYVYLNKINSQGGVHGRQVVLKTLDDKASNAQVLRTTLVWTSGPTLAQVEFGDVTRTGLGSTNLVQ